MFKKEKYWNAGNTEMKARWLHQVHTKLKLPPKIFLLGISVGVLNENAALKIKRYINTTSKMFLGLQY